MKDINMSETALPAEREIYSDAAGQTVWSESSGDFTLPEYMPEIAKMIKAEGRVVPSGKYIGAEKAEFSGNVVYSILYAGEDGIPYFTTLGCEYEYSVPLGDALGCGEMDIYDETSLEGVSVRPSGPRRLSVKSKIKATPHIIYKKDGEGIALEPSEGTEYQKLCKRESVANAVHFESGEFELEESFKLEGASPDAELIGCEGNVCISELRGSAHGIVCRGECECRIYYYDIEAGRRAFLCAQKTLRFEREIQSYHLCDIQNARAYGKVISADISAQDDTAELSLSLTLNIWGEYMHEQENIYVTDIYACGSDCDVEYKNEQLMRPVLCKNANFSFHSQKKPDGEYTGSVCCALASVKIESAQISNSRAEISGNINIEAVLAAPSDGSYEYTTESVPIPFKCEIPVQCTAEKYDIRMSADVSGVRVRVEKDTISADAELYVSICAMGMDSIRTVSRAQTLEDIKGIYGDSIRIYYPERGESLWSVGKKYCTSIDNVARANGIDASYPDSADSLSSVRALIIK